MICSHEMAVPGALTKAVRVLVHVNTRQTGDEIRHVYLKDARQLRPEWGISDDELTDILSRNPIHANPVTSARQAVTNSQG